VDLLISGWDHPIVIFIHPHRGGRFFTLNAARAAIVHFARSFNFRAFNTFKFGPSTTGVRVTRRI
jgi:hypothetical protein